MRGYVLTETGPELKETAEPKPRPGEIKARVRAAALNRVDIAMSRGHVHGGAGGLGNVLGVEWAGEIVDLGEGVTGYEVGQRVMGSGSGTFAEFTVADAGRVNPIPDNNMSFETASGLPVALQTMHDAVVTHGELKAGQSILIQGASSGVGLMGLKIAKEMGAGLVIGSSTNADRRARLAEFGADLAVDSSDPNWAKQVLEATGGQGVDLIVDQVSGPAFNDNLRATKILGRIVNVGRLGGDKAEFNFDLHAQRRISYVGVTFRTRSRAEVREINRRMMADLGPAIAAGRMTLPVDKVFDFEDLVGALGHMRANLHLGKIVLRGA
ncbi:MAG: zinc-binding dehydrogenase [Caulobacteraceae bacterium]